MSKVLLVEDSKLLRLASAHVLAKAGYEVITAADGEEALQLAGQKSPDLILLDLLLPRLSGTDVLKALKSNPATSTIPVIVLSSMSQLNEQKFLDQGAEAYFEKSQLELNKSTARFLSTLETVLARCDQRKAAGE